MANLNKVMLIGRLTREPEARTFSNGGKVVSFGFAVNNRKKNQQTGEWEDDPCFVDVKAFNRENGRKLADLVEQYLHKGHQTYIEGHLVMEKWQDKTTQENRSKLVVYLEDMQFLEPKSDGAGREGGGMRSASPSRTVAAPAAKKPAPAYNEQQYDEPEMDAPAGGPDEDKIPF
jgi:single-strand DNA-binding protein